MTCNRSTYYAIAIGLLADRFIGQGSLVNPPPANEVPLSRENIIEMQSLLTARGFDTGGMDGMIGSMTRKAVRAYQATAGLPADGYPTMDLILSLRK